MELRNCKGETEEEFLKNYKPGGYERPSVTVDMPIFTMRKKTNGNMALHVLLIQRKNHPFITQWALPGGFVELGESTETAAKRELEEETGIKNLYLEQFYTFSEPGRDPRTWVMTCAYVALADSNRLTVHAGDDAQDAAWFKVSMKKGDVTRHKVEDGFETETMWKLKLTHGDIKLKASVAHIRKSTAGSEWEEYQIRENDGLAFDHSQIITMAWMHVRNRILYGNAACHLLPEVFTLQQLLAAYQIFLGDKLTRQQFEELACHDIEDADMPGMYRKQLGKQDDRWI